MPRTIVGAACLSAALLATAPGAAAQDMPVIDEEAALAAVRGGFGGVCAAPDAVVSTIPQESYRLVEPPAYDGGPERHYVLYAVPCSSGAYNVTWVYLVDEGYEGPMPQAFATPKLRIDYEGDSYERVRSVAIDGFDAWYRITNASFDPETRTIVSSGRWRGLGDAFDSGTWRFEEGRFVLQRFEVDPTYDGEITPQVVFER